MKKNILLVTAVFCLLLSSFAFAQDMQGFISSKLIPGTRCVEKYLNIKKDGRIIFTQSIFASHGYYINGDLLVIFEICDNSSTSQPSLYFGNVYKYESGKLELKCIVRSKQKHKAESCMAYPLYSPKFRQECSIIGRDILSGLYQIKTLREDIADNDIKLLLKLLLYIRNGEKEKAIKMFELVGCNRSTDYTPLYNEIKTVVDNSTEFWIEKRDGYVKNMVHLYYFDNFSRKEISMPYFYVKFKNNKIIYHFTGGCNNVFYIQP